MREDVERLAALDRRTTRPGERAAAELIAGRLRGLGAAEVRIVGFRSQSTWAAAGAAHLLAGGLAALRGGRLGRALALATLVSYDADTAGRKHWLRRLLPAGQGSTVVARLPAAGERRRTLVVVAHHDAAHTGWVWSPALTDLSRRWGTPSHALPVAALAGIATGVRPLRRLGGAVLALALVLYAQAARSPTVPGANDNASGVAGALELARRLLEDPVDGLEVVFLFPGGEEASAVGMGAWMRTEGRALDPATTFVLGLDSIGSHGEIVTSRRDGFLARFRDQDLDLLDAAARRAGLPAPRRVAFPNVTDAAVARHAGLPAATLLTLTGGWIENLHLPSDRPEHVDWAMAEHCVRLARAFAGVWAEG